MICALHRTVGKGPCLECFARFGYAPSWESWQKVYLHHLLRRSPLSEVVLRTRVISRETPQPNVLPSRGVGGAECISGVTVFGQGPHPRCVFWEWPSLPYQDRAVTVLHEAAHAKSRTGDHGPRFRRALAALIYLENLMDTSALGDLTEVEYHLGQELQKARPMGRPWEAWAV